MIHPNNPVHRVDQVNLVAVFVHHTHHHEQMACRVDLKNIEIT